MAFNISSDIDFKYFINIYKKRTEKPYYFLVSDVTLASNSPLRFRKNPLERIRYFNRGAAKLSALSSRKIWINMNILQGKK